MKFYEKIIGIDRESPHGLMTITFNNGFFEFDKGLQITGNTTITGSLSSTDDISTGSVYTNNMVIRNYGQQNGLEIIATDDDV